MNNSCQRCGNPNHTRRRICSACAAILRVQGLYWCNRGAHAMTLDQVVKPRLVECKACKTSQKRAPLVESSPEVCPVCQTALAEHARCRGCQILIGPGHLEPALTDGLCAACVRWRAKQRRGWHRQTWIEEV